MTTFTLQRADGETLTYVRTLLARNDLPTADVRSNPGSFYLALDGDERVGLGGLEICGPNGLLRSVVVEASARGNGFGAALCDALESEARDAGVETLYLLTTTAAALFEGRGYVEIERAGAPAEIRETTEFAELCPASATCLEKPL